MFKREQTFKFNNFNHIWFRYLRLYAHKYKTELHSSPAVISNIDKAQKRAHEDKLKTSFKRLMYSEASDKSCFSCTAYSADSRSHLKWNKSEKLLIQSLRLCYAPILLQSKISSFYYIFSLQVGSAKTWEGKSSELYTVCHRNSMFSKQ